MKKKNEALIGNFKLKQAYQRESYKRFIEYLKNCGFKITYYIDRIKIKCDRNFNAAKVSEIDQLNCREFNHSTCAAIPSYPQLVWLVDICGLSIKNLGALEKILRDIDYKVCYLELAVDFSTNDEKKRNLLTDYLNRHLVILNKKNQVCKYENQEGNHYTTVTKAIKHVRYSDTPKRRKQPEYSSEHIELRFSSCKAIENSKLEGLLNIYRLDQLSFWSSYFDFRIGNKKELGIYRCHNEITVRDWKKDPVEIKTLPQIKAKSNSGLIKAGVNAMERVNILQDFLYLNQCGASANRSGPRENIDFCFCESKRFDSLKV